MAPTGTPNGRLGSLTAKYVGTASTNLGIALFGLATGPVLARLLGPEGRGELVVIQTIPMIAATLAMVGLPSAVAYFTAADPASSRRTAASAIAMALVGGLVAMVVTYLALPVMFAGYRKSIISTAQVYLGIAVLLPFVQLSLALLQGLQLTKTWNIARLAVAALWLSAGVLASKAGHGDAAGICVVYLCLYAISAPVLWSFAWRRTGGRGKVSLSRASQLLRFGLPTAIGMVPLLLNARMDQILLSLFLRPADVGLYAVAVAWSNSASPLLSAMGGVLLPALAASPGADQRRQIVAKAMRRSVLIAAATGVVLTAITPMAVVLLFGEKFRGSVPLAYVLVPALVVANTNVVMEEALRGYGRPRWPMVSQYAGMAATVGLQWLLLRSFGPLGAAVASLLSYALICLMLSLGLAKVAGLGLRALLVPNASDLRETVDAARQLMRQIWRKARPEGSP